MINNLSRSSYFLLLFIVLLLGLLINIPEYLSTEGQRYYITVLPPGTYDRPSEYIVLCDEDYRSNIQKGEKVYWMSHRDRLPDYSEDLHTEYIRGGVAKDTTALAYNSNIVFPRFILFYLRKILNKTHSLDVLHTINCILLSLCLSIILLWFSNRSGRFSCLIISLMLVLLTRNITDFGKNLYWQGWTLFAPMAISCIFSDGMLDRFSLFRGKIMWLIWTGLALLYKQICCFEFITCVSASAFIPIVLAALEKGKSSYKRYLSISCWLAAIITTSFVIAIGIKLAILGHDLGSFAQALDLTLENIKNRSINEFDGSGPLRNRSFVETFLVLLRNPLFEIGGSPIISAKYLLVLFALLHMIYVFLKISPCKKHFDTSSTCGHMLLVTWLGLWATASWPLLAAPHIHKHYWISLIVLWIPFQLCILATTFTFLRELVRFIKTKKTISKN